MSLKYENTGELVYESGNLKAVSDEKGFPKHIVLYIDGERGCISVENLGYLLNNLGHKITPVDEGEPKVVVEESTTKVKKKLTLKLKPRPKQ